MNEKKHKYEVDKLFEMEKKLANKILETGDNELMDQFSQWLDQRTLCNEGYLKWIESLVETK